MQLDQFHKTPGRPALRLSSCDSASGQMGEEVLILCSNAVSKSEVAASLESSLSAG